MKLLWIDDQIDDLQECVRHLATHRIHVDGAKNASSALRMMREAQYDGIILDVILPGESGLDLLREIRHLYPEMRIAICTMEPRLPDSIGALHDGALVYLDKNLIRFPDDPRTDSDFVLALRATFDAREKCTLVGESSPIDEDDGQSGSRKWFRTAISGGVSAALFALAMGLLPPTWLLARTALIVGVIVTLFLLMHNPKSRYMTAFWAVFGVIGAGNVLPSLGLTGTAGDWVVQLTTGTSGVVFNLVLGVVMVFLLALDQRERRS